jgi:hypothetical protein
MVPVAGQLGQAGQQTQVAVVVQVVILDQTQATLATQVVDQVVATQEQNQARYVLYGLVL